MEEHALHPLEHYYNKQNDETKACLLALKSIILSVDPNIVHFRKYQIPFFQIQKFQYQFFVGKQEANPAGFIVDKKGMPQENTKRHKDEVSTLEINPLEDIPIEQIKNELCKLIECYEKSIAEQVNWAIIQQAVQSKN